MTQRARPVVRPRRSWRESPERRNFLLNVGFGLVVLIAVIALIVAAAASWYGDHLAPVGSVNGSTITRDDYDRRFDVESVRLSIAEGRIADEVNAGRLSTAQGQQQGQFINQRRQQLASLTLERLIDARIQADLAAREGIQVTPAEVDAQIDTEGTRTEQRHAWLIEVAPEPGEQGEEPTEEAIAEARKIAETALNDLEAGKAWEEVAKAVSTDSSAAIGGDLGWISDEFSLDEAFVEALFALEGGAHTDLIEGEDGTFRIGRVTEVMPERPDPAYRQMIIDRGVPIEAYSEAVRQDLIAERLREKIEAQALAEGPQRRVAEIFLENQTGDALPQGSVKTRHILYAPKDDPEGAGQLAQDDPAWKAAEDEARKAHATVAADLTKFDQLAREESDETGADITGGKLPWFDPTSQLDPAFAQVVFAEGLQPGQLLDPVRSSFGWHVIQVLYFPTDADQANRLKSQLDGGADFAQLARDYSYGEESAEGGELGWIARYQLDKASEDAIFATPVGQVTAPVSVAEDGVHLYKVLEEATRAPEGDQKDTLEQSAFTNWYEAQKQGFTIERDVSFAPADDTFPAG
jgi:parvulin-like peptidyl-prolyl isomerase